MNFEGLAKRMEARATAAQGQAARAWSADGEPERAAMVRVSLVWHEAAAMVREAMAEKPADPSPDLCVPRPGTFDIAKARDLAMAGIAPMPPAQPSPTGRALWLALNALGSLAAWVESLPAAESAPPEIRRLIGEAAEHHRQHMRSVRGENTEVP